MQVDHHDLHHEFPEFKHAIHDLKMKSNHFAKLFDAYHQVTAIVEGLETKDVPVSDMSFEELKKQRLKLKDELYAMLVAHKA